MGGFKYNGKEMFFEKSYANERFTLMGGTLMRGLTVFFIYHVDFHISINWTKL